MQSRGSYLVPSNQAIENTPKDVTNLYIGMHGEPRERNLSEEGLTVVNFYSLGLTQLQSISIGSGCFEEIEEFVLDGLEKLENIRVGNSSFSDCGRICRITNCPNLRQLLISYDSFGLFDRFELSNVNSLQSIQIDSDCFRGIKSCMLKGEWNEWMNDNDNDNDNDNNALDLPSLEQVTFGIGSFTGCPLVQFESMKW